MGSLNGLKHLTRNADNVYSDCTYFIEYILLKMIDAFEDCLEADKIN